MSVKLPILLILFAFVIQSEARYGCQNPNTRSVYRPASECETLCRCTYSWNNADYTYKTVYKCDGFNRRIGEFEKYIKDCLKNTDFDDLIINNYKLERLPDSVFEGETLIKRIIISNSPSLQNFGYAGSTKTFFDGLGQSLETIVITNSPNIFMEAWTNLVNSLTTPGSAPPVLKNLIVYKQDGPATITEFATFNKLTNLEKIIFRSINLQALLNSPIDLTSFTKLRLLDLSENRLEGLFNAQLPDSLTTIYLNGNRELQGFDPQFFDELMKTTSNVDYINVQDPNKLDCTCANINDYINARLSNIFDGKCATPSQARGKPYLTFCSGPP